MCVFVRVCVCMCEEVCVCEIDRLTRTRTLCSTAQAAEIKRLKTAVSNLEAEAALHRETKDEVRQESSCACALCVCVRVL